MGAKKKSWKEKLQDSKDLPKVCVIDSTKTKHWGAGSFVIPAPIEVDAIMRKVPKGRLTTIDLIRKELARKHKATIACPMTTGIFAWIAAHAAEEELSSGKKQVTPYWRTLKSDGEINPKYPGGVDKLSNLLKAEGHEVFKKGKRTLVRNFESKLTHPV